MTGNGKYVFCFSIFSNHTRERPDSATRCRLKFLTSRRTSASLDICTRRIFTRSVYTFRSRGRAFVSRRRVDFVSPSGPASTRASWLFSYSTPSSRRGRRDRVLADRSSNRLGTWARYSKTVARRRRFIIIIIIGIVLFLFFFFYT